MPEYWKRGSTVLWLSPDVQYAHYVKEDDQKGGQKAYQKDDSDYDSEHEWPSLASLFLHDGGHKLNYKQAQWDAIFKEAESSVLIHILSSRS